MPAAALGLQRYKAKSFRPNFSLILNCMLYLQCRYLFYSLRWHFLYYWEIPDNSGFRWVTANQDFTINLYMKTMARHVFFFQCSYWTRYQNWIFETRLSIFLGNVLALVGSWLHIGKRSDPDYKKSSELEPYLVKIGSGPNIQYLVHNYRWY